MTRWALSFLVVFVGITGCAVFNKNAPTKPASPTESRIPGVNAAGEKMTPERSASNSLIEEGIVAYDRGLNDHSADLFQESINVDPTNGASYYYLTLVKVRSGEYGEAWGLIEKAELLFQQNPDWLAKVEEVKAELQQKKPD